MKHHRLNILKCYVCGNFIDLETGGFSEAGGMLEDGMCSSCRRWKQLAKEQENLWVINNQLFELHARADQSLTDNGLTKLWYIMTPNKTFIADSLFNYGEIPEALRPLFHNHAIFMHWQSFQKIHKRSNFRCRNKGCWGRKNCWWYEGEMNYNKIPSRLKNPNPEDCPIFIDKSKFKTI